MNANWESLIRAIVPLSFMAIWALTSLFNRDAKPKPTLRPIPRPDGLRGGMSGGPGEPTLRFGSPPRAANPGVGVRRPPPAPTDNDGIIILSSETNRLEREREKRTSTPSPSSKRPSRGKSLVPQRKADPIPTRAKLAGVSQNVNQHLTTTNLELTPLAALSPVTALGLTTTTPAAAKAIHAEGQNGARTRSLIQGLADPAQLRQAFVLNEILQAPVSMRQRRVGPASI